MAVLEGFKDSLTSKTFGIPNYYYAIAGGIIIAFLLWRMRGSSQETGVAVQGDTTADGGAPLIGNPGTDGGYYPIGTPLPPERNPVTGGPHDPSTCPDGPNCSHPPTAPSPVGPPVTTPLPVAPPNAPIPPTAALSVSPQMLQAGQVLQVVVSSVGGEVDEYEIATAVSDSGQIPGRFGGWQTWDRITGNPPQSQVRTIQTTAYQGYDKPMFLHVAVNLKNKGQIVLAGTQNTNSPFSAGLHSLVTLMPG